MGTFVCSEGHTYFFRSDDLCQLGDHTDYDDLMGYCWFEERD